MARKSRKHLQNPQYDTKTTFLPTPSYKVGIYVRVSSGDKPDSTIENQICIAEAYISNQPDMEQHKVYIDRGVSSFSLLRQEFRNMLSDLEIGIIDCVIVKDISRFTRDYLEAGELLQRTFPALGARFISISDGFDSLSDDPTALSFVLRTLLAYEYSRDLSRKITSAIFVLQETGLYVPPRLPYGYNKAKSGNNVLWQVDEGKAKVVKEIFDSVLDGQSAYTIACNLNEKSILAPNSDCWRSNSVLRILRDETYVGTFVTGKNHRKTLDYFISAPVDSHQWIRHRHHHTPIVSESVFYQVQVKMETNSRDLQKREPRNDFFCGKLYCGICGRKMKQKKAMNGSIFYTCPRRDEANACVNKSKNIEKLKAQVYKQVRQKIDETLMYREKMLAFEESPYYLRWSDAQNRHLKVLHTEYEQQMHSFRCVFEKSVATGRNHAYDSQQLLGHLSLNRRTIQEEVDKIEVSINNYRNNESSNSLWIQPFLQFAESKELTAEMVQGLIVRVNVGIDGVKVLFTVASKV